jgi:hypothetical protein
MNLTTATPVQIDTQLAAIDRQLFVAYQRLQSTAGWLAKVEQNIAGTNAYDALRYKDYLPEARKLAEQAAKVVAELEAQAAPLHAEYDRRPWTRAWMVMNTGGHAHRVTNCSTCFPTTRFGWLPQVAGMDQAQIIAAIGSDACTVCYPDAPVVDLKRPRTVFTLDEQAAQAERDAKAAKKAEREAKKAAAAITNPDGTRLRGQQDRAIYTEREAQIEYYEAMDWAEIVLRWNTEEDDADRIARNIQGAAKYHAIAEHILTALAAKRHPDLELDDAVAAERAALAPKVAARKRKADRQWAADAGQRAAMRARNTR